MKSKDLGRKRGRALARLLLAATAAALLPLVASAQPADPSASYRELMQQRMEASQRAVTETVRRRIEEGKSDSTFPSDANREASKPGVVRASPEEQKALAHNERGLDFFAKGKFEQAVKEYDEAIRINPALAAAYNNRGSALFALGRFEEAAAGFRQAAQVSPKYGQARFNLALALIKLGREKEANDALMAAANAYFESGEEHLKNWELKEAEEDFKGILQIDPDYPPAHLYLGLVYNAERDFDSAVQSFNHVLARRPDNTEALVGLGSAYLGQRKYADAVEACDRAIKLRPADAEAYYTAGVAAASLGQREQALARLDKLRQLKADDYAQRLSEFISEKAGGKQ
ncbi:MAG TPA: tetratricopeptide repeat protein, partial [Pyrinomonadaceae bacterium]|jgi:tetratricopeptide (TPR) repeat protein|nr:tetratricopeptide repeat protein [Pyrinomonadaceae bacterium]